MSYIFKPYVGQEHDRIEKIAKEIAQILGENHVRFAEYGPIEKFVKSYLSFNYDPVD